jgi:hypothetical protein
MFPPLLERLSGISGAANERSGLPGSVYLEWGQHAKKRALVDWLLQNSRYIAFEELVGVKIL